MLHIYLTPQRSLLLLEGLWDQLESVVASMRTSDEQPAANRIAQSRIDSYRTRLREVIARTQVYGATDPDVVARRILRGALCEVVELLDHLQTEPTANWIAILYQAQDAVLAALQELRVTIRVQGRAAPALSA
jgi:hypothetical protein